MFINPRPPRRRPLYTAVVDPPPLQKILDPRLSTVFTGKIAALFPPPPPDSHLKVGYAAIFPDLCHQSPAIPPWPMFVRPSIPSEVDSTIFEKGGP